MSENSPSLVDAMNDPNRPLTIDPNTWLTQMKGRRGRLDQIVSEDIRVAQAEPKPEPESTKKIENVEDAAVLIDSGVDNIIAGMKSLEDGLNALDNLSAEEKKAVDKVRDLLDTAIAPYVSDIIEELAVFEGE